MMTQKLWKYTRDSSGKVLKEVIEVDKSIEKFSGDSTKGLWYEEYEPCYNLLFTTSNGSFNVMDLPEKKLPIILKFYEYGNDKFTLSGSEYIANKLRTLRIFTYEKIVDLDHFRKYCTQQGLIGRSWSPYFNETCLAMLGADVTEKFIGDHSYGYKAIVSDAIKTLDKVFVNPTRISELKQIRHEKFDLNRLITLCHELNDNYSNENYLSVGMIGRTIINHIPPIFGFKNFDEVANNSTGTSFKSNMQQLNIYLKNVADSYLHQQIRKKEVLPNHTQVEFRIALDVLLEAIILKLHH